jgi:hypothetical protein
MDKDPIPLHPYDQLLPADPSVFLRRAARRARRLHGLIERMSSRSRWPPTARPWSG